MEEKYKLPNGWEEKRLDDLFKEFTEKNHADKNILASTQDRGVIPSDLLDRHIIRKKESLSNYKLVKKGCFVISLRSFQGGFEYSNYEGIISPAYTILEPKIKLVDDFYKYYFKSYYFINKSLPKYAEGIRDGKQIKYKACKEILVPYPPLDEQKRIASALSKIDAYLENTIKLIEEKERFKRGIAKKLLTCKEGENIPEARFKGFEDEWKEYNLSKIGVSYNGLRNKKANSFVENCNAKYITYKSVYDKNKIDINRLGNVFIGKNENQNLVKYGDVFFTISSETPDEVAISSVLLDEVENTYLNSFCFGFRFDFNILLPEFARYYFRSDYIRKSTYRLAQGITRYNISKKKFLDIIIYLPSLEEQKKIGGYLSLLDAEIDNLKKQKELIKEMKRGAMQKLLSGEVRLLE